MSLFARLIAALLIFCTAASCSEKNLTGACEKRKILAEIRHRLLGVEDYKIKALVSLEGVEVVSRITGKMPDRLRIRLEIPHPTGLTIVSAVFDGTNQWVETKKSSSTQVIKIYLAELTTPERPFDTSYYIMGTGLLNGEGYPETIATLLSVYDLKAACSDNVITLSGPINIEKFKEYAAKRRSMGYSNPVSKSLPRFLDTWIWSLTPLIWSFKNTFSVLHTAKQVSSFNSRMSKQTKALEKMCLPILCRREQCRWTSPKT